MRFAPGCLLSPYSRPTFLSIFPWSLLGKISENGRFRSPWQICHNSALRALMEAQFAEKMFLYDCTSSACKLGDDAICARVFLKSVKSTYFFEHFPVVPPWQNLRKWPI